MELQRQGPAAHDIHPWFHCFCASASSMCLRLNCSYDNGILSFTGPFMKSASFTLLELPECNAIVGESGSPVCSMHILRSVYDAYTSSSFLFTACKLFNKYHTLRIMNIHAPLFVWIRDIPLLYLI
ncbi:hypothetical protein STEG23_003349 [Scotinomys teguina]